MSTNKQIIAHKLVAKVAAEAAGELYEVVMSDNLVRSAWLEKYPDISEKGRIRIFRRENAGRCLKFARATLATLLTDPRIDESVKSAIHEALVLDAQIPHRMPQRQAVEIVNREMLKARGR